MQEAIRLKLQQVSPIKFLRLPERPVKKANISWIERRRARGHSLIGPSFSNRRLGDGRGERGGESCTHGGGHGSCRNGLKLLTPRQNVFIVGRQFTSGVVLHA